MDDEQPEGAHQRIPADPAVYDGQWLHARFFTGIHADDIRCRTCSAMFPREGDVWAGFHASGCPVAAETVPTSDDAMYERMPGPLVTEWLWPQLMEQASDPRYADSIWAILVLIARPWLPEDERAALVDAIVAEQEAERAAAGED